MTISTTNIYVEEVPFKFQSKVCRCGSRPDGFTLHPIPFPWWVCANCLLPAPLNATNARLYRECEICEDYYWVSSMPDRMDLCKDCA